jgi:predicted alpha/beta superfamily hydrolase
MRSVWPIVLTLVLSFACGSAGSSGETPDAGANNEIDATPPKPDAETISVLDELLEELRDDAEGTVLRKSREKGWPIAVEGGVLVVSLDPSLNAVAGDHDDWSGTAMTVEEYFSWAVIDASAGSRYKFRSGNRWEPDPYSRAYHYDDQGLMSQVKPDGAHLERFFQVGDQNMEARMVRVWVPAEPATHVLYCHDGQNLFSPYSPFGGWKLLDQTRSGLLFVGIDNTGARMSEYTHVSDMLGGNPTGGSGDAYASYLNTTIRELIEEQYGEPAVVGTMGSSLGGLISLHIADRYPGEYDFAASLSGTLGWGSMFGNVTGQTMIERYQAAGHRSTAIYLDSGGNSPGCADLDGDGLEDDGPGSDNYCETKQMETVLAGLGYTHGTDLWHWHQPGAPHNEASWAERVFRPIDAFMAQ